MSNQKKNPSMKEILNEKDQQTRDDKYNQYVKNVTPKHSCMLNLCKAFLVGGIICTIGQCFIEYFKSLGLKEEDAVSYNLIVLILLSIILTGFGIYPKLAKFGGAGTVVPITGFANSVVAPALEYKKEGQVFGIGCKIFTIAGPVILYGVFSSWLLGLIYWVLKLIKVV